MINIKRQNMPKKEIKRRRCIDCHLKIPTFNFEGKRADYCAGCKKEGMVRVTSPSSLCQKCKKKRASYNIEGEKAKYCVSCKKENMVDVVSQKCRSNEQGILCPTGASRSNYDGYCGRCFVHLFPNDKRAINYRQKSKELKVVSFVNENYKGFTHDRPIYLDLGGGCCETKRRIDLRKLIGNTMLCIEIDENQHKYYDPQDEQGRYDNLFMDFSGKFVFIRYNPDQYKDAAGKNKNPRAGTRLQKLKEEIDRQTGRIENEENEGLVEILHLYYDEIQSLTRAIKELVI